jgi:hypothetical protein
VPPPAVVPDGAAPCSGPLAGSGALLSGTQSTSDYWREIAEELAART